LLKWPPAGAAAVQGLADAVAELERALLAEGWTPLPPGPEWYAKRFAWIPVIAAASAHVAAHEAPVRDRRRSASPAPAGEHEKRRTGRFRRNRPLRDYPLPFAWPPGSDRLWRSEIRWDAGVVNSRFEAVAFGPGEDRDLVVGRSAAFRWLAMNDPDPATQKYQSELGQLRTALEAAGWEHVGRGANWYSARFVWRRTGTPPDHIELPERGASPAP
jgi:hypothetical protein